MSNKSKITYGENHFATEEHQLFDVDYKHMYDEIKSDKWRNVKQEATKLYWLEQEAKQEGNLTKAKKYWNLRANEKAKLSTYMLNATLRKRNIDGLKKHYGDVGFDFDHLKTEQNTSVTELKEKLKQDKHINIMFESPSGDGLKGSIKTNIIVKNDDEYKTLWNEVTNYFKKEYNVVNDSACKDICRVSYSSHDKDCYLNENAIPLEIKDFAKTKTTNTEIQKPKTEEVEQDVTSSLTTATTKFFIVNSNKQQQVSPWVDDFFLNYCLNNDIGDNKHKGVEKNFAIYLVLKYRDNPETLKQLKDRWIKIQRGGKDSLKGWLKSALECKYPQFSHGEVANFIKENKQVQFTILSNHHYSEYENEEQQEIKLDNLSDLLSNPIPELEYIIDKTIPEDGITIITGQPGDFKSWMAQAMAVCVSTGKLLLNKQAVKKSPILYIDEENGLKRMVLRLQKILTGMDLTKDDVKNFHIISYNDIKINKKEKWSAEINNRFVASISKIIKDKGIKLIVLDSLVRLIEGEENSSSDMKSVYNSLKAVIKECPGIAFLIIHHNGKSAKGNSMNNMRGSSDLSAMASVLLEFRANRFIGNRVSVTFVKHREIDSKSPPALSFEVEDTTQDEDGNYHGIRFNYLTQQKLQQEDERIAQEICDYVNEQGLKFFRHKDIKKEFIHIKDHRRNDALKYAVNHGMLEYKNKNNGRAGYIVPAEEDTNKQQTLGDENE